MNLMKYVHTLTSAFKKRRIGDDLKNIRDELRDTKGVYDSAADFFEKWNFRDKAVRSFNEYFKRSLKTSNGNFITITSRTINNMFKNIDALEDMVEKYFEQDVFKEGMSYVQANLLLYIELADFTLRYSRRLLHWTYMVESNELGSRNEIILSPAEIKWLVSNEVNFTKAVAIMNVDKRDLLAAIGKIPDAVINEQSMDVLVSSVGMQRLDPLALGFVGVKYNPIYHARIAITDWQDARHKARKEEIRVLEFRLMNLRNKMDNVEDPKLQNTITYYEEQLQGLQNRVEKYEEDLYD